MYFTGSGLSKESRFDKGKKGVHFFTNRLANTEEDKAKAHFELATVYSYWKSSMFGVDKKSLSDSSYKHIRLAHILDPDNKEYFYRLLDHMTGSDRLEKDLCYAYLKKNPNDFKVWHQMFVYACNSRNFDPANEIYIRTNKEIPNSELAKLINFEVKRIKRKQRYKWSDICSTMDCKSFNKYTSPSFYHGPSEAVNSRIYT